jgi:membrane-associated progesterone receptor component
LQYIAILTAVTVGYVMTSRVIFPTPKDNDAVIPADDDADPPDPPRNFTKAQLRHFDGGGSTDGDSKFATAAPRPVYLSVKSIVFDVSNGRDFYGPGGPYETFAGRECGAALAKMAFDEHYLDDPRLCDDLNFGEKSALDDWLQKFEHYRCYPIVGRLIVDLPDPDRVVSADELAAHKGNNANASSSSSLPDGYAAAPIYVAVDGQVFDMSFGGISFYGPGGPYHKFAGNDVTRALAVMKIDEAGNGNHDLSDLTEKQVQTMKDWVKTFRERKQYPIVGKYITNGN